MRRVISSGGGLNSQAMVVKAIELGIDIDYVAFCDVADKDAQDPGEWPGTYRHLDQVIRPLCEANGIKFEVIDTERFPVRGERSLYQWLDQRAQIPVAGPNRICTRIAKVDRFEAWMAATFEPGEEVEVWLGFEKGEEARVAKDPNAGKSGELKCGVIRRNRFPLIEWDLCRCRCEQVVRRAGLPVARKSACVFCPYSQAADFATFARELPVQFDSVARLEERKMDRPTAKGGYRLSIKDWHKHKVSAAQLRVLGHVESDSGVAQRDQASARACLRRGWVVFGDEAGWELTSYGREIIELCKAGDKAGDVVYQRTGRLPIVGVHYAAPTLRDVAARPVVSEEVTCKVCHGPRATKRTGCSFVQPAELVS